MTDSQQLLADYVANGSESAFRELVARYLNLVFSTALRLVDGDTHRAEDVAQTVFVDLARMAPKLSPNSMLGGWLHRHTCFVARTLMRGERRRHARERQAVEMNALENQPDTALAGIAPLLDEAINDLPPDDRDAILLRFFERRNLRSIGEALGISENVAQKRVARALQELASLLQQRGVALSATALAGTLAAGAVTAAPAGLALTLAHTALAAAGHAAAAGGIPLTAAKVASLASLKLGMIGVVLVAGVALTVFLQNQPKTKPPAVSQPLQPPPAEQNQDLTDLPQAREVSPSSFEDPRPELPPRSTKPVPVANVPTPRLPPPLTPPAALPEQTFPGPIGPSTLRFYAKPGSRVRIQGTSNLHDWQVESSIIGGFLELDPDFLLNPAQPRKPGPVPARAEVFIHVTSLKSIDQDGRPYSDKMDQIMYEQLKSTANPKIYYRSADLSLTGTTNSNNALLYQFESRGELIVAGVTNQITLPISILPLENAWLRISGTLATKMTAFQITPPGPKIGPMTIKAADDVSATFDWIVQLRTAPSQSQPGWVPLLLNLPAPAFKGTPPDLRLTSYVEPLSDKPRPPMMIPPGLKNLAPASRLTSSDRNASAESLAKITDGDKDAADQNIIFLRKGPQWVQLDLRRPRELFAIVIWHAHNAAKVYHDVIVQASPDKDFRRDVETLFNNDHDNTFGLGTGVDPEYFETHEGKLLDAKGLKTRFLRFYSKGSTESALNEYTEIEVYGRPAQ